MVKKFLVVFSFVILLLTAMNLAVLANPIEHEKTCTKEITYDVSMDEASLIEIALEQYEERVSELSLFSADASNILSNIDEFVAVQEISEMEYSDGTSEKAYVTTGLILVDKETEEKVTPSAYLAATNDSYEHHMDYSQYGLYLAQSTYWTVDMTNYPFSLKIQIDSVATRSRNATELYMESVYNDTAPYGWHIYNTVYNPGYDQIYWLSGPGRFVQIPDRMFPIWSGASVVGSNGQTYYIQYYVNENAEYINGQPA